MQAIKKLTVSAISALVVFFVCLNFFGIPKIDSSAIEIIEEDMASDLLANTYDILSRDGHNHNSIFESGYTPLVEISINLLEDYLPIILPFFLRKTDCKHIPCIQLSVVLPYITYKKLTEVLFSFDVP